MDVVAQIDWNKHTLNGLIQIPDRIVSKVAKETLDLSETIIPADTHTLVETTMANGVRGGNGDYYLKSDPQTEKGVNYATYVWNMSGVHWTTPGTNNKWFARTLKIHGATIINSAIDKGWKEVM
jgi:hypothetical protein